MNNFNFHIPTKIIFGKDAELSVGKEILASGGSKVLVHFGGQSAKKSGLLDRVENSLTGVGLPFVELGGVVPNPRLSKIREGISLCQKENVDFLLAVGGGSVIDSAKGIGLGLANPSIDVWDIYAGKAKPVAKTPIGVVLTIAATGSEMSASSVVTNEDGNLKYSFNNALNKPVFACMNPELTMTLPPYQTASGVVDIMMHTIERYFAASRGNELSDRIAEQVLRNTIRYGKAVMENPMDYKARSEIMWNGTISHNGLTGLGNTGGFSCHVIEHELSASFDVAHGAGLSAIWCWWARMILEKDLDRFVQYAVNVWDCELDPEDRHATALAGIKKTEEFFISIGMPVTLHQLGINPTDAEIDEMATKCSKGGTKLIGPIAKLTIDDLKVLYKMANVD